MRASQPRILLYDIETAPPLIAAWERYETDALWEERPGYMLCYAYKWLGEARTRVVGLPEFKTYKRHPHDDKELIQSLYALFEEADIIVAHNGDGFDQRTSKGRFLVHGFGPPAPFKQIDTLKVSRKHFRLPSHKLDDLAKLLGVRRKVRTGGIDLWYDVVHGDMTAWNKMMRYNKQDVRVLEDVYLKLRPWIENHPALNLYDNPHKCPKCGLGPMQARGYRLTKTLRYRRYQCQNCGGWSSERESDKSFTKPILVN